MALPSHAADWLSGQWLDEAWLRLITVCASLVALGLVGILAYKEYRGQPIHYFPPSGPGLSWPGQIPPLALTHFAGNCLQAWYTFTPTTVKDAHARARSCLHPERHTGFDALAAREQKETKTHKLSSQLTISDTKVTKKSGEVFTVVVLGSRTMMIGSLALPEQTVRAEFTVVPMTEPGFPFGLAILGLESIQPKFSVAGD